MAHAARNFEEPPKKGKFVPVTPTPDRSKKPVYLPGVHEWRPPQKPKTLAEKRAAEAAKPYVSPEMEALDLKRKKLQTDFDQLMEEAEKKGGALGERMKQLALSSKTAGDLRAVNAEIEALKRREAQEMREAKDELDTMARRARGEEVIEMEAEPESEEERGERKRREEEAEAVEFIAEQKRAYAAAEQATKEKEIAAAREKVMKEGLVIETGAEPERAPPAPERTPGAPIEDKILAEARALADRLKPGFVVDYQSTLERRKIVTDALKSGRHTDGSRVWFWQKPKLKRELAGLDDDLSAMRDELARAQIERAREEAAAKRTPEEEAAFQEQKRKDEERWIRRRR